MESQDQVYEQFEQFNFESEDFLNGLENVFESYLDQINSNNDGKINEIITEIKPEDKERLIIQAKTFYFCSQTGNILNIEDYEEWKQSKPTQENLEPEYSSNYQEVVQLILQGKEVPGIKQIPDTILEGQSSKSQAQSRKKPWELQEAEEKDGDDKVSDVEEN